MQLTTLDWSIIAAFFIVSLIIGIVVSRKAGSSSAEFFLSGRNMPWWLLGVSMVATTFSADTPNLVTDIVRKNGVSGNWVWWAFLLTGMLTVFVYSKLWRRSGVLTDLEFYEIRYGGKSAAFLRGFRAIYLGVFFNVMIMATVCLAAIKIGGVMLGLTPIQTLTIASVVTVLYSSLGGLRGVLITDFFQFILAMVGTVWAASLMLDLPQIGGLDNLLAHQEVASLTSFLPDFSDTEALIPLLIIPLAVQWWSVWYPGSEPGGGGYIAQRMLAAKDEKNAMGATLFFNIAHYALRPWPWIIIALCSVVIFPKGLELGKRGFVMTQVQIDSANAFFERTLTDEDFFMLESGFQTKHEWALTYGDESYDVQLGKVREYLSNNRNGLEHSAMAYIYSELNREEKDAANWSDPLEAAQLVSLQLVNPRTPVNKLGQDLAYPSMLSFLPIGLLGLVIASLVAAFMSTISTHLNWGSSYVVNDFYQRFVKPDASEKELVTVGRVSTLLLMVFAALFALVLNNALQAFGILLQIGAGTGLIFILRWFWWRINAWTEISGMVISFVVAVVLEVLAPNLVPSNYKLVVGVAITTVGWLAVTFLTQPETDATLKAFCQRVNPTVGWGSYRSDAVTVTGNLPLQILGMFLGCVAVYTALFATGSIIYGNTAMGAGLAVVSLLSVGALASMWKRF
jgi:Na+/proline symporter